MSGRLQRLHRLIERPGDVWLAGRMAFWTIALPVLRRFVRLETLARLMWTSPGRGATGDDVMKIAEMSHALARRLPQRTHDRCYERSLLAYRYLSRCGADPRLVVALRRDDAEGMAGHAWVTVGGVTVGEQEPVDDYVPLVVFGRDGERLD